MDSNFSGRENGNRKVWPTQVPAICMICALAMLFGPVRTVQADEPPDRTNILLITADDLGTQLGCYGTEQARTPHLARLARQGLRFENAYVTQASCSPSRSSIFTGLYPHQNGMIGLSHYGYNMHQDVAALPQQMQKAGYHTGVIGKIHVGSHPQIEFDWRGMGTGKTRDVQAVADQVRDYLSRREQGTPFFLMINYFDPHKPLKNQVKGVPEDPITADEVEPLPFLPIDSKSIRRQVAGYLNCVTRLDRGVGLLRKALNETGYGDNTLVLFVGDHGPPLARAKTTCYEAGVRVPLIAHGPMVSGQGRVSQKVVSTVDIPATLVELAGREWPHPIEGRSLVPLLLGRSVNWREYLFTEYTTHAKNHYYPRRAVRGPRYKLIVNTMYRKPNPISGLSPLQDALEKSSVKGDRMQQVIEHFKHPPRFELYDLKNDPHELVNLAGQPKYESIGERLMNRLRKWQQRTNDFLLGEVDHERVRKHGIGSQGQK